MNSRPPSYSKLLRERVKKVTQLEGLIRKSIIRGSIRIQGNRCGAKRCRCKRKDNPIIHGPYPYLSYRGKDSNHSILLTKNKKVHAEKAISNYKEFIKTAIDLSDVDFNILRYHNSRLTERGTA
jgi:hypothetical protein